MYNLSFKPERGQTGNWGTPTLFLHPGKASRMLFLCPTLSGPENGILNEEVYYKPTHFQHRFKTQFSAESWTIVFISKTDKPETEVLRPCFCIEKSMQGAIFVSNPIWAGKWHSYIKKCITNRRIFSTGSKHHFLPNRGLYFLYKKHQNRKLSVQPYLCRKMAFLMKKCITNRRIFSTGSKHNFLPNRGP